MRSAGGNVALRGILPFRRGPLKGPRDVERYECGRDVGKPVDGLSVEQAAGRVRRCGVG